jgi:hypothetical protein
MMERTEVERKVYDEKIMAKWKTDREKKEAEGKDRTTRRRY